MPYPHRRIESYVHNNKIGVLIEFGMFSDITSEVPEVKNFMRGMAMHIAANAPLDIETLMEQSYIKNPDKRVVAILKEVKDYVSEEIEILRFVRWGVGDEDQGPKDPPRSPANVIRLGGRK